VERTRTVLDLVDKWTESDPEVVAALAVDGQTITYLDLQHQIVRIAAALRAECIRRTDRVITVLSNGLDAAVGFLGTASYATTVPLNPDLGRSEFAYCFNDLDAKALLVGRGLDTAAFAAADECGVKHIEYPFPGQDAWFERGAEGKASDEGPMSDDVALILYTSGTTSTPKRVPLTHANLIASARNVASGLALSSGDRCLNVMPLFHIHGLVAGLLSSLVSGGRRRLLPHGYDGSQFLDWLGALPSDVVHGRAHDSPSLFSPRWIAAASQRSQAIPFG